MQLLRVFAFFRELYILSKAAKVHIRGRGFIVVAMGGWVEVDVLT